MIDEIDKIAKKCALETQINHLFYSDSQHVVGLTKHNLTDKEIEIMNEFKILNYPSKKITTPPTFSETVVCLDSLIKLVKCLEKTNMEYIRIKMYHSLYTLEFLPISDEYQEAEYTFLLAPREEDIDEEMDDSI